MSGVNEITYEDAVIPTNSDAMADPAGPFAALYVGVAGNVKLQTLRNNAVVFVGVPAGSTLRVAFTRVWSTGTTATSLLGLLALPYKKPGG
jgi:hypothetical protein